MKIITLGGYNEVGMNMTALEVNGEFVILDMGLYMPKIVGFEDELEGFGRKEMIAAGAIPDDNILEKYRDKVVGIVLSHAHLDHIGAVPYLARKYDCKIIGSPYTIEILKRISDDKSLKIKNKLYTMGVNDKIKLSENITVEFANVTHSTVQCVIIIVHTPEGSVVYANDFKLDDNPVVGQAPNYKKLRNLENVKCLIANSLYSTSKGKTPSESVAREMLKDTIFSLDYKGKGVIVTCFASHIQRLKSIVDFGKKLNRRIVFLGRSLHKYVDAAKKIGLINFKGVEVIGYSSKIKKKLKKIGKSRRDKYLVVCTGNQAEPGSVLDRMVNGLYSFKREDNVVFSCKTIPVDPNEDNREKMEKKLEKKGVNLYKDVHVSGHGSSEDLRKLIKLVRPENIIPAHADWDKAVGLYDLGLKMGYSKKKLHHMRDGKSLEL